MSAPDRLRVWVREEFMPLLDRGAGKPIGTAQRSRLELLEQGYRLVEYVPAEQYEQLKEALGRISKLPTVTSHGTGAIGTPPYIARKRR